MQIKNYPPMYYLTLIIRPYFHEISFTEMILKTLLALIYTIQIAFCQNGTETELHTKLFQGYNPDVRPVLNTSETVEVVVKLNLMSFDNIDEKKQSFSVRAFLEVKWTDEFLTWDPEENGVRTINVQTKSIWLPDLALEDVYDRPTDLGQDTGRAVVNYNGSIVIWPYKLYTVACKIKIHYFPFDVQNCVLDFLSWTNPSSAMQLLRDIPEVISFGFYRENGEWELDSHEILQYQRPYGNDSWDHIKFSFSLRRKWLFQVMNIIAPIVCISLLNLTCFVVPAESGEKIALCISMFLTLAVFLTTITSLLPESSDEVSILGIYVCLQLLGSGFTIVFSVVSLQLYHRDKDQPVSNSFLLLCKVFCQSKSATHRIKYQHRNGIGLSYVQEPDSCDKPVVLSESESRVTWTLVSHAFDRLCFVLSLCWNVCLLVGLSIAFHG